MNLGLGLVHLWFEIFLDRTLQHFWTVQFGPDSFLPVGLSSFVPSDYSWFFVGSSLLISGSSFDRPVLYLTVYFRSFGSTSITSKDRTLWPLAVHGTPQFKARLYGPQAMMHSTDNIPTTLSYFRHYNSNINWPFQLQWFFNFSCTNLVPNFPTSSFFQLPFPTTCDPPVSKYLCLAVVPGNLRR